MRNFRFSFTSAILLFLCLFVNYGMADVIIDPHGFAVPISEGDEIVTDITLTNNGDEDVTFDTRVRSVRREQDERLGPRRDNPGDIIQEVELNYLQSSGFAWDVENRIMYAAHTVDARITGYEWDGEEITDVPVDFVTNGIPAASLIALGYFEGVLYTVYWVQTLIYRYDTDGNQLESIVTQWDAGIYGSGITIDPETELLYYSGIWANDAGPAQIKVYDMNDDFNQVGLLTGFEDIGENHNTDVRNRITWAPEHTDGNLWIFQRDPDGDDGLGPFWPPYAAWQVNVIPGEDEEWDWELVDHFEVESDAWSNGIGHDGENLWIGTREEQGNIARVVDDGIIESGWLFLDAEEGVIPGGEDFVIAATAMPMDFEPGVHELKLRFMFDDPDLPYIEMSAVMVYDMPSADLVCTITDPTINDGEPVEGIQASLDYYLMTRYSDENGELGITDLPVGDYTLLVTAPDYLPQEVGFLVEEDDEVVELAIELEHAEFNPSTDDFLEILGPDDATELGFTATNDGNGDLEYTAERRLIGDANADPWNLRLSYNVGAAVEDNRIEGVIFVNGNFYVSGENSREPAIYIFDQDGNYVDQFFQPNEGGGRMRDLAWDGTLLWGADQDFIYGFTLEGNVEHQFESPFHPAGPLTYDPVNQWLWLASTTTQIVAFDLDGNEQAEIPRLGLRKYGLAYYPDDPDGCPLYLFHYLEDQQTVSKWNADAGEWIFVRTLTPEEGGSCGGAFITNTYDIYSWVFMNISNDGANDRIDIWQLDARRDWFGIAPEGGVIVAGDEQDFTLTLNAADLTPERYQGEIVFTHNGVGAETIIPVELNVRIGRINAQRTIGLERGWNMSSVNLQPEPMDDVPALMASLVEQDLLLLVKNSAGNFYNPEYEFCNIEEWIVSEGYLIKVDEACELTLEGMTVLEEDPIALVDGWQMIAYYPRIPIEATIAFSGIENQLTIAKDGAGQFYNPEWGFSNMGNLREGLGYQVKVDGDVELVYQLRRQEGELASASDHVKPCRFLSEVTPTGSNMSLLILAEDADDAEIGVYCRGLLVGSGVVSDGRAGVAVWGDDPTTLTLDGAADGDELTVKLFSDGEEVAFDITYLTGKAQYQADEFAVGKLAVNAGVPNVFSLAAPYPNPFNSTVRLSFNLPEASDVLLTIHDLQGRLVATLTNQQFSAGLHNIVWKAESYPSGVYVARLNSELGSKSAKMLYIR